MAASQAEMVHRDGVYDLEGRHQPRQVVWTAPARLPPASSDDDPVTARLTLEPLAPYVGLGLWDGAGGAVATLSGCRVTCCASGSGLVRAVLRAVLAHPDVTDVRVFAAGVDADNQASQRCAAAGGFRPDVAEPDWEDTVYYLLPRSPAPDVPSHGSRPAR